MSHPIPLVALSCEQCQRRKTRCDKISPCSACVKAGISCASVKRHRLPRGRSGNKALGRPALRDRIGRLEAIVSSLRGGHPTNNSIHPEQPFAAASHAASISDTSSTTLQSYIAPHFWTELTAAVAGLRDILEDSEELDDGSNDVVDALSLPSCGSDATPGTAIHSLLPLHFLFPAAVSKNLTTAPPDHRSTPRHVKYQLLTAYRERVDAIFRVLHWPSTVIAIEALNDHAHNADAQADLRALEAAIYFTAVCSLLDHEVQFRQSLVDQYRSIAEEALANAQLLTTSSVVVLQALTIYLVCMSLLSWRRPLQVTIVRLAFELARPMRSSGRSRLPQYE